MWSHHFMANRWGINANSQRLYFLGLQNHCRWWLQPWNKKMLAPRKKSYDQPRQQLKNRDITLPTKVHIIKAMVFPVVMYGCESWTVKKAEHQRIDAFGMLLESLLDCKETQQSILKEISPEYSLEGLTLKLKLQYFGHMMRRAHSLEKTWCWERLKAGGEWDDRGWDGWMALLTQWTWVWVNSWELLIDRRPGVLQCTGSQRVGHDWATELTDFFIQTNHCFLRPSFKPPKQSLNSVTASCKHIFT